MSDELAEIEEQLLGTLGSAAGSSLVASQLADCFASGVTPLAVPATLRQRLLEQIGQRPPAMIIKKHLDATWQPTGFPGISRRILFVDRKRQLRTLLVKLDAGAKIPAHPHTGTEEFFLLEGDLQVENGPTLRAGDYQRFEAGTHHVEQLSIGGCLGLMISEYHEEQSAGSSA